MLILVPINKGDIELCLIGVGHTRLREYLMGRKSNVYQKP